jgi:hypothetical protein
VGKMLALVLLYARPDIDRLPRVQDFVSSCHLVQCAKESAGKRYGTSGTQRGHAYLTGAFSAAAAWCLRNHPETQQYWAQLEKKPGQGTALTMLAHKPARVVYEMLQREIVFAMPTFLHSERAEWVSLPPHWSRRGAACIARAVSLGGLRLCTLRYADALHPRALRGDWPPALAPAHAARVAQRGRGLPLPCACRSRASRTGSALPVHRPVRGHRIIARPQSIPPIGLCTRSPGGDSASIRVWCCHTGWPPVHGNAVRTRDRLLTTPEPNRRKKIRKSRSEG